MKIMNSRGPKTDPWGTPLSMASKDLGEFKINGYQWITIYLWQMFLFSVGEISWGEEEGDGGPVGENWSCGGTTEGAGGS